MVSGPTFSWEIEVEKGEALTNFLFCGSKFTTECDGGYKIRRQLLTGRKTFTNLESILKNEVMT